MPKTTDLHSTIQHHFIILIVAVVLSVLFWLPLVRNITRPILRKALFFRDARVAELVDAADSKFYFHV